jgi:transposase InsO family protein
MHTGIQTGIGVIVPKLASVKTAISLSKQAKLRLQWVDYYHSHGSNASLTCRHFGICHRTFYRYYERFKKQGLVGLEVCSHRPARVRQPTTPLSVVDLVRKLRKANPELSKYKLAVILKRDNGCSLSSSSVGRIISRYHLFFTPPIQRKCHPNRLKSIARIRKPKDFIVSKPGDLIEVDVKHLPNTGARRYGFVAIDVFTKQAAIYVASTISAAQGALAWKKAIAKLGLPKAVMNDNGSENLGAFAELVREQHIPQYFARPHTPKDKPHVERFIGSLERECLQWGGVANDLADQQDIIDKWLIKYHSYRPHQALNYLTPDEYKAKLEHKEVALII